MQRIFLIHGWTGRATRDWFPWAKAELSKMGYEVFVPEMPNPDAPVVSGWVEKIKEVVGSSRPDDIFVGHSLGCMGLLQYFQSLPGDTKIGKVILIAGFERLTEHAMTDAETDYKIMNPWYQSPVDYQKIRKMADSWTCVFSDNDTEVDFKENSEVYKEKLGATIILKKRMGHFSQGDGIKTLPFLLGLIK